MFFFNFRLFKIKFFKKRNRLRENIDTASKSDKNGRRRRSKSETTFNCFQSFQNIFLANGNEVILVCDSRSLIQLNSDGDRKDDNCSEREFFEGLSEKRRLFFSLSRLALSRFRWFHLSELTQNLANSNSICKLN